jgi:hypothetical protein
MYFLLSAKATLDAHVYASELANEVKDYSKWHYWITVVIFILFKQSSRPRYVVFYIQKVCLQSQP